MARRGHNRISALTHVTSTHDVGVCGAAQDAVMDILLMAVRMDAVLSLEPILELIATLARDLHADFLPYLPRVTAALSDLVDSGECQQT